MGTKALIKGAALLTMLCGSLAFADETQEAAVMQPEKSFDLSQYGEFSGKIRSLTMARDFNEYAGGFEEEGHSSVVSGTLNYLSPEFGNFRIGAQYVAAAYLFEHNPDRVINNDFHVLNEAYLQYNLRDLGLEKSYVKGGRIIADYLLMSNQANTRHKAQAYEGFLFRSEDVEDLKLSLGWFRKFSSYSTRHKNQDNEGFNYEFTDVAKLAGADYKTDGTYFVDATYTGIDNLTLLFSDFYSEDLFNTALFKTTYKFNDIFSGELTYANQESVGEGNDFYGNGEGLSADYYEAALAIQVTDKLTITPAFAAVGGREDGGETNSFQDLFLADLRVAWPLMANPYGFLAGTRFYMVDAYYEVNDKLWLWGCYAYSDMDNKYTESYDGHEFNVIAGYQLNERTSIAVKLGAAILDGKNDTSDDTYAYDSRLFIDYVF